MTGPLSPLYVTVQRSTRVPLSSVVTTVPVPWLEFGGTLWVAASLFVAVVGPDMPIMPQPVKASVAATSAPPRSCRWVILISRLLQWMWCSKSRQPTAAALAIIRRLASIGFNHAMRWKDALGMVRAAVAASSSPVASHQGAQAAAPTLRRTSTSQWPPGVTRVGLGRTAGRRCEIDRDTARTHTTPEALVTASN